MFWLEFRLMKINENPIGLNQLVQLEITLQKIT